ncbi:response regulator transcription factor [Bacteroides sp. OF04-15BH]|jgi:DNA-binding response OmpR family regulator|uniref:response regulator transcription factor n=1 Tax=Bacteroides sp. OF04-15BH TaxID=2292281 RepID=UPI000E4F337B|nr:response regulator transcription factor [Bacteroides sp. OF04-15BH]RHP62419.1 DNA-binding response regulator [Bacteroides sp. OF04-15BH]
MKILVVEDEDGLRDMVRESLEKEKYIVECASDYQTALTKVQEYDYDCVLLDIMLPGGSGLGILSALKRLRKQERVIILSAKDSVDDKIKGLDMGADDYLAKPFHLAELHARIKSLLRRKNAHGDTSIILENLVVYPDKRQVMVGDTEIQLNRKEFDLLYYFVSNPNRLINKTSLAESVWGDHIDQADSLDFLYSQVKNLRKKMKQAGAVPEIKAVYGFGYKLIV